MTRMFARRTESPARWARPDFVSGNYKVHQDVFSAIRRQDVRGARRAMAVHMNRARKTALTRFVTTIRGLAQASDLGVPRGAIVVPLERADWRIGYYREIIPTEFFVGLSRPDTAIAGGNDVSWRYSGGLLTAEYRLGKGRMLLNTLWIRRNLGTVPQAERLLRNMLNHMAPVR